MPDRDERMAKFQEAKQDVRKRAYRNLLILGIVLAVLVFFIGRIDFTSPDDQVLDAGNNINKENLVDGGASPGTELDNSGQTIAPAPLEDEQERVSFLITAESILDNLDTFNPDKLAIVPEDGIIFPQTEIVINEGETAFDLLARVIKDNKIHFDHEYVPAWGSNYIKGIGNIYEMDGGPMSGWAFQVNGDFAPVSADQYLLEAGDAVEWVYFCDFGFELDE